MLKRLFQRLYAAMYDLTNGPAEKAGLRQQRHDLLAQAAGATIEIGAGTGLNLPHYPPAVTRVVLTEPDPYMARRLRRRTARLGRDAEIFEATADHLPVPDGSFDTAVVTFALCSVPDVQAALSEITRVLAPGGWLLFFEHVRSADPGIAAKQNLAELTARDAAHATNNCTNCEALAEAFQIVYAPYGPNPMSWMITGAFAQLKMQLTALEYSGLGVDQIQSISTQLVGQVVSQLQAVSEQGSTISPALNYNNLPTELTSQPLIRLLSAYQH